MPGCGLCAGCVTVLRTDIAGRRGCSYMRAMLRRFTAPFTALATLLAFGCVDPQAATTMRGYPSLAKRPIEDQSLATVPESPAVPAVVDPALSPEAATLVAQGRRGIAAFEKEAPGAQGAVAQARGAAVSSEKWVQAQARISALDSARYDSVAALAGLDTLYVAAATGDTPPSTALVRERGVLAAAVDRQNDLLDGMRRGLVQP